MQLHMTGVITQVDVDYASSVSGRMTYKDAPVDVPLSGFVITARVAAVDGKAVDIPSSGRLHIVVPAELVAKLDPNKKFEVVVTMTATSTADYAKELAHES